MIEELLNPWIRDLVPYSSARSEFSGRADILLDANESWEGGNDGVNRYPDPTASALRRAIEREMGIAYGMTAIGNGSDEVIDLLIRMFCAPGRDSIMIERPTYGTYSVFARTSDISVIDVPLTPSLELDTESMLDAIAVHRPKIVFICSPNNPTGRVYPLEDILRIAESNEGITVVDEAYADFARDNCADLLKEYPNLILSRTFSKSRSLAGLRFGYAVAHEKIIEGMMKVKDSYNVSMLTQKLALASLWDRAYFQDCVAKVKLAREMLSLGLWELGFTMTDTETNFVFASPPDGDGEKYFRSLREHDVLVRYFPGPVTGRYVRITVGTTGEMADLVSLTEKLYS